MQEKQFSASSGQTPEENNRRCPETRNDGQPCRGFATATGKCAGHSKLGAVANPRASQQRATEVRSENAQERKEARRLGLNAVLAAKLEEHAETFATRYKKIVDDGDDADSLRAMRDWADRVLGRPTERVEAMPTSPVLEELAGMSPEQRAALLASVAGGKRLRLVDEEAQAS